MTAAERFPFVQLELAGSIGLDEARYLAREPEERVLVVRVRSAPAEPRRRIRRRRPRDAGRAPDAAPLPLTTLTVIAPSDLGGEDAAESWLERVRADGEAAMAEIGSAVEVVNRALSGQRAAALDPYVADISAEHARTVRIGYGGGEELAEGRWERAIEIPRGERRRRAEVMRPQETIAELLSGRLEIRPSIPLILRARADLDAGRIREAALQLRVGLEALLAELDSAPAFEPAAKAGIAGDLAARQRDDVAELTARRRGTGEAANAALRGALPDERAAEVAETLAICERVVRRRRAAAR